MAGRWRTGDAPRFAEATELDWNQMRPVRRNSEYTNDQVAVLMRPVVRLIGNLSAQVAAGDDLVRPLRRVRRGQPGVTRPLVASAVQSVPGWK